MSIAVPKRATLTDIVQGVATLQTPLMSRTTKSKAGEQMGQSQTSLAHRRKTTSFPSNPQFWKDLLVAVRTNQNAQLPPLFLVEDKDTNDSIAVNQMFLFEFVESWEEDDTHFITVSSTTQLRTFRASAEFWRHVQNSYGLLLETGASGFFQQRPHQLGMRPRGASMRNRNRSNSSVSDKSAWVDLGSNGEDEEEEVLTIRTNVTPEVLAQQCGLRKDGSSVSPKSRATSVSAADMLYDMASGRDLKTTNDANDLTMRILSLNSLQMSVKEWSDVVNTWNSRSSPTHERNPNLPDEDDDEATGGQSANMDPLAAARIRSQERLQGIANANAASAAEEFAEHVRNSNQVRVRSGRTGKGYLATGEGGQRNEMDAMVENFRGRERAKGVFDPTTAPQVVDEALAVLRRREEGSHYWTHFMHHWTILEAQYRNYLQ